MEVEQLKIDLFQKNMCISETNGVLKTNGESLKAVQFKGKFNGSLFQADLTCDHFIDYLLLSNKMLFVNGFLKLGLFSCASVLAGAAEPTC